MKVLQEFSLSGREKLQRVSYSSLNTLYNVLNTMFRCCDVQAREDGPVMHPDIEMLGMNNLSVCDRAAQPEQLSVRLHAELLFDWSLNGKAMIRFASRDSEFLHLLC